MLVARQLRAIHTGRNFVLGNASIHGARFNGLDQTFDGQRHGIGAESEIKRSVMDFLEYRLLAVNRVGPLE